VISQKHSEKVWWGLWLLTVAAILVGSLIPDDSPASEAMPSLWWNVSHIPAYALLGFLTVNVMGVKGRSVRSTAILAGLAGVAFGILIEIVQPFIGRMGSAMDASLNILGTLLGVSVASLAHRGRWHGTDRKTRAETLPRA
jgi:VanZ family protein